MNNKRGNLGFEDELESFNPSDWEPKPSTEMAQRPSMSETEDAANAAGFKSREPRTQEGTTEKKQRRRRTGRNVQINIKTTRETIEAFYAIADEAGWGLGEAFEKAVALLDRQRSGKL